MRQARYEFDLDKQYFAWVVAAKLLEMPGVGEFSRAIKITLATPYFIDGDKLRPSGKMEAVIWVVMRDDDDEKKVEEDAKFLGAAGITLDEDQVWPPKLPVPRLSCRFAEPLGRHRYQQLADWKPIPPGKYPVEPVVVATRRTNDLLLDDAASTVARGTKKSVKLGPVEFQLLRVLDEVYPNRISPDRLRTAVWKGRAEDGAIAQAVAALRIKLKQLGYTISKKRRDEGWTLTLMKSDRS